MPTTKLRIIHFDVSQGESTLISLMQGSESIHVLIDGGKKCRGKYVAKCLEKLGVKQIDYLVCTHLDGDHHDSTCSARPPPRPRTAGAPTSTSANHGLSWFVCDDCTAVLSDGFDCTKL